MTYFYFQYANPIKMVLEFHIKGKDHDNGNGCKQTKSTGYGDQADR